MWERAKRIGRILSQAGTAADWIWRVLVLVFGVTVSGLVAWASTTWEWYWSSLNWAGAAIAFLAAYIILAVASLALALASSYLRKGVGVVEAAEDAGPITWWHGNLELEGGFGRPVFSLRFHGTNSSQREVELLSANITSAVNGTRIVLEVVAVNGAGANQIVPIDRIQVIPPGAPITLVAKFNTPDGLQQQAFLDTWRQFSFNAQDDTRIYRTQFNEGALMAFFPGHVGPRVMQKPEPAQPA